MDFLRRLLGTKPVDSSNDTTRPGNSTTAPEITQPGARGANKARTEEEINEAAVIDATPIMFGATRQLPPLESITVKPGKHVVYGVNSDIGMIRNNNQDSLYTFFGNSVSVEGLPDFGLFVVADGMGGHHDGERASAIAIRTIAEFMLENFYLKLLKTPAESSERPVVSEVLSEAVQKANDAVSGEIPEGGTTVTAAVIFSDLLYIAHVGDSRAYLLTNDGIEQVTRDHSLVQRLIELEQLTPEEAAAHPQRNVLYRAIGQSENLEVDAVTRRLTPGCRLLLCSDGLWNQVQEENLLQIIQSSKTPQEACDRLVRLANDRGGPDNITVVLVQIPG
jgi:serine/threonine protein phosphatase PrpC